MIFIERDNDGKPFNEDAEALARYFKDIGLEYETINIETIKYLNHQIKTHFFYGSVEFMKEVFFYQIHTQNITTFKTNPTREGKVMHSKEMVSLVKQGANIFIKPYGVANMKRFNGFLCSIFTISFMGNYSGNVICYEPFDKPIESEWRAFIDEGEIVEIRNYSGDPCVFPNKDFIKEAIKTLEESDEITPSAYCVDVGVFDDGENTVIEFTDMWSLGAYGADPRLFFRLLKKRYYEILKECQN